MNNNIEKFLRKIRNAKNALLISMLIGSLIGAAVMMLTAPQSGVETRAKIHNRNIQWRDRKQIERLSAALESWQMPVAAVPESE